MQNIKRVAWKRRMESRYLNLREEVNELKRSKNENNNKNENNEDKTKSVKLKETIVIENGEQITTIDDVVFTSTEFVTIAKQPTMKKRVSCLVPVVWTQEVIQKKYLNPRKNMEGCVLITDADKLKFDQLCYHFQKHRKINYETGGKDDPNFHSKPWLGRRCTELRNVLNQKNKVHQAPPDG
ncbi:GSCOCG00012545001-RA-CDS [Cotesia congregata]|nr:GSCOCG00012545001-RA-CDS [Cotesia congregata]